MKDYNIHIIINPIYNRRERKFKIVKTIIILIFNISILIYNRERFRKLII